PPTCFLPTPRPSVISSSASSLLLSALLLLAVLALSRILFLPLGDRAGLVLVHLVVHAFAVLLHHLVLGAFVLVVLDALIDPLHVVGAGDGPSARNHRRDKHYCRDSAFHHALPNFNR